MREHVSFLTLFFFLAHPCLASLQSLTSLPENKIDIGIVALTLAKEIYPAIKIRPYSSKIDDLADKVRRLANGTIDPDRRVRCLNTVILRDEKFRSDRDPSFRRKPDNYFMNNVLDTKQGNCYSMPILYAAIAQRLGWPIYIVHVPDHSFVRYVDPTFHEQNIETTSAGDYVPDDTYAKDFRVSAKGRASGAYLRTLSYRETVADLLAINGVVLGRQGQIEKAIAYLQSATEINPRLVTAWASLGTVNMLMARQLPDSEAERYRIAADQCAQKLTELGFVHPYEVPQLSSSGGRRP